jgi:hypothetical protein
VRRWHPQYSEALDAVSHSDVLMVLPSSTITSKVAKKSKEHRRTQAQKEHRLVETENARMREYGELCVQERNLVADQAYYNSGSMVATKAILVTALLREIRKVWLVPGDGVVTASENLASPPGTVPKREARQLRSYYRDWRNHDCEGSRHHTACALLFCFVYRMYVCMCVFYLNLLHVFLLHVPSRIY